VAPKRLAARPFLCNLAFIEHQDLKKYSFISAGMVAIVVAAIVFWPGGQPVPQQLRQGLYDIKKSIFWDDQPEPIHKYGIDIGDLYVCTDVVRPNENLGKIMGDNGIPYAVVDELLAMSDGIFDVSRIKAGKSYCLMRSSDTLDQVKYFIYEQDPINYVVYEIGDTIKVSTHQKKIDVVERKAAGVISSSLWNALNDNDLDPQLAISMSEIYAWSVDFFRLQKGDFFKVIFDQKYVEGQPIGIGEIKGALFNHAGADYYAVKYDQDSLPDYFDEKAMSLRKAFLKAPLQFSRISSNFNHARFHPILKVRRPHLGTDYAASTGTPIWSIGSGVVVKAAYNRGSGNFVEIRHNKTVTTRYLHMSGFAPGIKAGATVAQGQTIGYVGSTGLATGPHLHFEMLKNGVHTDATKEQEAPGIPIRPECEEAYTIYKDQIVCKLQSIPYPQDKKRLASADEK
jgi:murein DD-endopeptidase MepM/ murein hydrolase activator NlpD